MREILFRGKRLDNGEWIYGDLLQSDNPFRKYICPKNTASMVHVDCKSIGQYTGLCDRRGERIFEGDIVDILPEADEIGVIEWSDDEAMFMLEADVFCANFDNYYSTDGEVIGNIHDNPDLLKGE